jgi:hypothetical protein
MALGELVAYLLVTAAATLWLESGLLREAASQAVVRPQMVDSAA